MSPNLKAEGRLADLLTLPPVIEPPSVITSFPPFISSFYRGSILSRVLFSSTTTFSSAKFNAYAIFVCLFSTILYGEYFDVSKNKLHKQKDSGQRSCQQTLFL